MFGNFETSRRNVALEFRKGHQSVLLLFLAYAVATTIGAYRRDAEPLQPRKVDHESCETF